MTLKISNTNSIKYDLFNAIYLLLAYSYSFFKILKEQKTECSLMSIDDKNYISQNRYYRTDFIESNLIKPKFFYLHDL